MVVEREFCLRLSKKTDYRGKTLDGAREGEAVPQSVVRGHSRSSGLD